MELLAARGNVAEALRVYDRLRVLLRDELGATPAPHVTALHDRLLMQGEAPGAGADRRDRLPLPAVLARARGAPVRRPRARARRRCAAAGRARRPARAAVVVLAGEAGMGKTRLAARFAAEAHAGGAAVLHGRIDEETVVPYQPFVEALRHYAAHAATSAAIDVEALRAARPGARAARAAGVRASARTAATGCSRRSRRCSAARPASARCCSWSRTSSGRAGRRCCCCATSSAACTARRCWCSSRCATRRPTSSPTPRGCSPTSAASTSSSGSRSRAWRRPRRRELVGDAELARRLHGRTAGNPFFIEEMLRSLAEAPDEPPGVPEGVKDLVSRRLARLRARHRRDADRRRGARPRLPRSPRSRRWCARPGEELLGPLEEALRAGVVREDAEHVDRFAFAHALVRETLYDAPAHARRARLHLRAGRALEAAGAPPGELAHHFFAAREVGGAEAAVDVQRRGGAPRGRRARLRGGGVAPRAGARTVDAARRAA